MRKDAPGFTLVECAIVLALLAVLLGLALPELNGLLQRQRTTAAMHLVGTQLAQARTTAITRRQPVTLCPSLGDGRCHDRPDWSSGWLLYVDPKRRDQPLGPTDILADVRQPLPASIQVLSSAGRRRVRYQADGRAAGANLTLRICQNSVLGGEIIVNNIGRIRSRRPQAGTPCPAT